MARDIHDGARLNLGIGMPAQVAHHLAPRIRVVLHSESGILGTCTCTCTQPLTGVTCVKRTYTDPATLSCLPQGPQLFDKVEGAEHAELERLVGLPIVA